MSEIKIKKDDGNWQLINTPGATGPVGPAGASGPAGATGPQGVVVPIGSPFDMTSAPASYYVVNGEVDYQTISLQDLAYAYNLDHRNLAAVIRLLQNAQGSGYKVTTSSTAPPSPKAGDIWIQP